MSPAAWDSADDVTRSSEPSTSIRSNAMRSCTRGSRSTPDSNTRDARVLRAPRARLVLSKTTPYAPYFPSVTGTLTPCAMCAPADLKPKTRCTTKNGGADSGWGRLRRCARRAEGRPLLGRAVVARKTSRCRGGGGRCSGKATADGHGGRGVRPSTAL